jgi:four helix bundle protein
MQNFRRLHVWERAHQFALDVRIATESFPRSGYSELKAQLVRAAESIPTNIVEGCGASSRKEFARYLDISIKSTFEVEYQLQLAKDYSILLPNRWESLSSEVVQIRRMLYGLRKSVLTADRNPE